MKSDETIFDILMANFEKDQTMNVQNAVCDLMRYLNGMSNTNKHGGKRPRAGRKPGKKAFKKVKPNPTEVRRIPVPLLEMIDQKLNEYYDSIGYKKLKKGRKSRDYN